VTYRFNRPPEWPLEPGFTPDQDWRPDPSWPPAPEGWVFWVTQPDATPPDAPQPPAPGASAAAALDHAAATTSQKVGGLFRTLKTRAHDEDWKGKAKSAASQAATAAQQATGQATALAKQRDQSTLDKAGPLPEGALWRGVSHEAARNSIVTLYPDRIERVKPTSRTSLSGMLTGGAEDIEVIPAKSISSVQVRRGPWYHDVTVYASGNTIILSVDAADAEQLRGLIMAQVLRGSSSPAPPAPAAEQPSGDALFEQIKKLGELREAGLITPEEFDTKKSELLGRL
jgi:hypothetical protein